ncbi:MAG: hypothetical protein JWO28_1582 [Hyphomicrobiales bacterium]|nr:hypothetical protein [Hyphomicrobiales bacterium]
MAGAIRRGHAKGIATAQLRSARRGENAEQEQIEDKRIGGGSTRNCAQQSSKKYLFHSLNPVRTLASALGAVVGCAVRPRDARCLLQPFRQRSAVQSMLAHFTQPRDLLGWL